MKPKPISDVLSQLLARRGYAREQASGASQEAWQQAAGEMIAKYSRPGLIKRGVLEVTVANSILVQEATFQKAEILARLQNILPHEQIRDLRFRVGQVS